MPRISRLSRFITKITNWEYWPFFILYFPIFFYFGWLVLRTRSLFFFTASNPSIDFGGMFGEKKSEIFEILPKDYIPTTILIKVHDDNAASAAREQIGFPLICKPDVGERGIWVKKITSKAQLADYVKECPVNFLMQALVTHPVELGVFFVKYPGQEKGRVTSIVRKEFLKVVGDGQSTIMELLQADSRAVLTANLTSEFLLAEGEKIPEKGEEILVEPIGNHSRGTKFLNDQNEIDGPLNKAMNELAAKIPDFYFGRFDLKCQSLDDLRKLKNFKILELNGAGAEPGHIYQPGFSLISAYKDIVWHLRVLADISMLNHKRGISYWSFKEGYRKWKAHKMHNRLLYNS